ncbi:MAG: hypothetical protein KAS72_07775 [Phycisphaerales bacterium]|nr:hypothetical protein [Phycisphaerales bacterium]
MYSDEGAICAACAVESYRERLAILRAVRANRRNKRRLKARIATRALRRKKKT